MHVHEELNRDLVIIPIRDRSKKKVVYSKYDGVTVINITKEKGGKACYDCGILKKKTEELRDHQRYPTRMHKTKFHELLEPIIRLTSTSCM